MELKFTGIVQCIEPIQWSGDNKDHKRQSIDVKGIWQYHKNWCMFTLHWDNIELYPVKEWDVVDVYYHMNTGRYKDTGNLHWSNNVYRIVQVDEEYDTLSGF